MAPFEPDTDDVRRRRGWVAPLVFLALSILVAVLPRGSQETISSGIRGSVLAPFLWVQSSLHEAQVLSVDLTELQSQLDSAIAVLNSQTTLELENQSLRSLLGLAERDGPRFIAAAAIRSGTLGSESMFMLDVGSSDGVGANDPVVSAEGLVGVVRSVTSSSAVAMDWTNPDFRASGMTVDGEVLGIVEPRQGAFREEDRLVLTAVPFQSTVEDGTLVVTSGRGAVYPRGIPLGLVAGIAETEAGWARAYFLDPAVRPGRETHVLVLPVADAGGGSSPAVELWTSPTDPPEPEADGPGEALESDLGVGLEEAPAGDPQSAADTLDGPAQ